MRARWRPALLATLSVGLGAGCGASSLSASQLRTRATPICHTAELRAARIVTPTLPSQGARYLRLGAAVLGPEITSLSRLRPSGDLAGRYRDAVKTTEAELRVLRSALEALKGGADPVAAIRVLQLRLTPLEAHADRAWTSLSLPTCASR